MNPLSFFRRRDVQLASVAVAALAAGYLGARVVSPSPAAGPAELVAITGTASRGLQIMFDIQAAFRRVAGSVVPSVVEVDAAGFGSRGVGSGVIVKSSGATAYVLTNNHVAGEAAGFGVRLADGRSFRAALVGRDEKRDLALVSFQSAEAVPVASLGDSDSLQVGDWVLAIGTAPGLRPTVAEGIVSALGREIRANPGLSSFSDSIQTDAVINEGNSGGALVNIDGQVVGINGWVAGLSGQGAGLGFAIPINSARKAIDELFAGVSYGWLGVSTGPLREPEARDLYGTALQGAFVRGVFRDSPAARAGLRPGDTILSVNGQTVVDATDLLLAVGNLRPGSSAALRVRRGAQEIELTAALAGRSDEPRGLWPGLAVVLITPQIRAQLDLPRSSGDLIVGTVAEGSPAQLAGFRVGDIVREVGGHPVGTLAGFFQAVNQPGAAELRLTVSRRGREIQVALAR